MLFPQALPLAPLTPFPSRRLGLAGLGLGLRCGPLVLLDLRPPKSSDEQLREHLMRHAARVQAHFVRRGA